MKLFSAIVVIFSVAACYGAIILDNGVVRLVLTDRGNMVLLENLVDGALVSCDSTVPIWRAIIWRGPSPAVAESSLHEFIAPAAFPPTWRVDTTTSGQTLTMRWSFGGTLAVVTTVYIGRNDTQFIWNATVENSGGFPLFAIDFPMFGVKPIGGTPDDDWLLLSGLSGTLIKNPYDDRKRFVGTYQSINPDEGGSVNGQYPGIYIMQFSALYDSSGGIYWATNDTLGYLKLYSSFGAPNFVLAFIRHFPENNDAVHANWSVPYSTVLVPSRGDWIDAAMRYRRWGTRQWWCSRGTLAERGLRNLPSPFRYPFLFTVDLPFWHSDIRAFMSNIRALLDTLGLDTAVVHIRGWGHWLPDMFADARVIALVESLKALGIRVAPYSNTRLWNISIRDDALGTRSASMAKNPADSAYISWKYTSYIMDPSTPEWQRKYRYIVNWIRDTLGATDIYCDNFPSHKLCYRSDHAHPKGGGHWWTDGLLEMFRRIRSDWESVTRDFVMVQEARFELWLDVMDALPTPYWQSPGTTSIYSIKGRKSFPIPLFRAVYGDYVGCIGHESLDWEVAGAKFYRFNNAYNFVNGSILNMHDFGFPTVGHNPPEEFADRRFMAEMVRVRKKFQQYLLLGRWLRPPAINCDSIAIEMPEDTFLMPAVLSATYKFGDSFAFVLVNHTDSARELSLRAQLSDYDVTSTGKHILWHSETTTVDLGPISGSIVSIDTTLPPRGIAIVELAESLGGVTYDGEMIPRKLTLKIYPNPFNSVCKIVAPYNSCVKIYDLAGKLVKIFVKADDTNNPGKTNNTNIYRTLSWRPDENLGSGVYFIRAEMPSGDSIVKKVLYLK